MTLQRVTEVRNTATDGVDLDLLMLHGGQQFQPQLPLMSLFARADCCAECDGVSRNCTPIKLVEQSQSLDPFASSCTSANRRAQSDGVHGHAGHVHVVQKKQGRPPLSCCSEHVQGRIVGDNVQLGTSLHDHAHDLECHGPLAPFCKGADGSVAVDGVDPDAPRQAPAQQLQGHLGPPRPREARDQARQAARLGPQRTEVPVHHNFKAGRLGIAGQVQQLLHDLALAADSGAHPSEGSSQHA
mmetsp:Transcript_77580/g.251176  ORF Transcript_77580/g.251176 Transcript_77580/m.251176 type:complete len:242 (-) Transcript_77580:20-745(-)